MRLARRGVGWDRAQRARVYTTIGRVLSVVGVAGILIELDPYLYVPPPLGAMMAFGVVLGIALMFVGLVVSSEAPREMLGDVEVDEAGALHVRAGKKALSFARAQLRGAWLVRRHERNRTDHWVEIATRSGTMVTIHVLTAEEGYALVESLGFEAAGRAVRMPLAKRTRRRFHLLLAVVAYLSGFLAAGNAAAPFAVVAAVYFVFRFAFRPPILEIGHDALHVHVDVRTIRIPRADIARVHLVEPAWLVIERKDGSQVRLSSIGLERARVAAAAALVDARIADRPAPARATAFERGGRGLAEWRVGLQTGLEPTYRSTGTSIEDATAVLMSATASVEQRIGAALALRVAGEPLEKVRIAAEGTVDPKIRVVLEAIADGEDDERVEETLRAMER